MERRAINGMDGQRFAGMAKHDAPDVLFIPCAGPQGKGEGSDFLTRFLRRQLASESQLIVPDMPEPEAPHYATWQGVLERVLSERGERKLFIVGHSLGASVALKYLSEKPPLKEIEGLFLISAVYWGAAHWQVEEYKFRRDFQRHLQYIPNIFFYHSKDDAVVPVSHLWHFALNVPDATIRAFDHEGHLFLRGIPQLVRDMASISPESLS